MRPTLKRGGGIVTACFVVAVSSAIAVPADASTPDRLRSTTASPALETDFTSIVRLNNCSGSIVRWEQSKPDDLAMMLTNGHCRKTYGPDEVVVDVPSVRTVTLLKPDGTDLASVSTTTVLYGTMSKTDVALYQLDVTYRKLKSKYDVPGLTIAAERPAPHKRVVIMSGFWRQAYRCQLNGFVYRLKEDVYTWQTSLRYSDRGCKVIHGTSGSPVMDRTTRDILGIHNTTNDNGLECTINNPCEVDRDGHVTVHQGRHYGEETWWLTTCVAADRSIDLGKSGCKLRSP